jgi:putative hydrolase of the HAD superfamily
MEALMSEAVIFDLWRTLVPLTAAHKVAAMDATAVALDCDDAQFRKEWAETRVLRETRALPTYLQELAVSTGRTWTTAQMEAAMAARLSAHYQAFSRIRSGATEVLAGLRADGFRLGLVSNCSSDVRWMLQHSGLYELFDAVVLSAEVGCMKPDPRIFRHAVQELAVTNGFYVGDGDDGELLGARSAGLVDILLDLGEGRSGTRRVERLHDIPGVVTGALR